MPAPYLPDHIRRRIPKGSTYGLVPMWTAEKRGDEVRGLIRVPDGLCHSKPMTEKRRQFNKLVEENISKWIKWRKENGWILNTKPKVTGPFDPPSKDSKSAPEDVGFKWYFVTAHFTREYPLFMPTDAAEWFKNESVRFGLGLQPKAITDTHEAPTKKVIKNPERVNPLEFAAKRREELGIKPDDWTQQKIVDANGNYIGGGEKNQVV